MCKMMDMHHPFKLSTKFWRMSKRLRVGQLDFGRPAAYPAPLVAHALHDDDVDGKVAEAIHNGLPIHPSLPLGYRWRVPFTRVYNPSDVLLLYRDQLDAQTLDQVMIYVKVYGSLVISFICSHMLLTSSVNV